MTSPARPRRATSPQLLRDFMREFVQSQEDAAEHDAWFSHQVQAGIESANAGKLIPAVDVVAHFATRRAATRRRLDTSGE